MKNNKGKTILEYKIGYKLLFLFFLFYLLLDLQYMALNT